MELLGHFQLPGCNTLSIHKNSDQATAEGWSVGMLGENRITVFNWRDWSYTNALKQCSASRNCLMYYLFS